MTFLFYCSSSQCQHDRLLMATGLDLVAWYFITLLGDTNHDGRDAFGTCIPSSCCNLPVGKGQNLSLQGYPV